MQFVGFFLHLIYLEGFDGGLFPRLPPLGLPVVDGILPPSLKCVFPGFTVVFAIVGLLKKIFFLQILLEKYLSIMYEFQGKAKSVMHNDEFELNPFVSFAIKTKNYFSWTERDKRKWRPIVQHIIDLFIKAGADPDEKTKVGTARELLKGYGLTF